MAKGKGKSKGGGSSKVQDTFKNLKQAGKDMKQDFRKAGNR